MYKRSEKTPRDRVVIVVPKDNTMVLEFREFVGGLEDALEDDFLER